jgi:hypothetical protein
MTAQELRDTIAKKEEQLKVGKEKGLIPESAQNAIAANIEKMKKTLSELEAAEKKTESAQSEVKKAEGAPAQKAAEKKAEAAEDKEKKVEKKAEETVKSAKKTMTEAQKKAAQKYREKQKAKKEEEKKKKEAAATKKRRAKKATKAEAKTKKKAAVKPAAKPAPKKKAVKATKAKRVKRATKTESISSFLAKNKTAKAKYKGVSTESKKRDADKSAKPFGYRLKGKGKYRKPTKAEIKAGKAYWEGRPTKADVSRTKYPKLEEGGALDERIIGSPNDPEMLAGGEMFAEGGGIFSSGKGNRTHHNRGRSWHQDQAKHNKSEDYEIPLRKRAKRKKKS